MTTDHRITRGDLEAKLQEIRGDVDQTAEDVKPYAVMAAVAGIVVVVALAYLVGRRKGRRGTTVVEIRRV